MSDAAPRRNKEQVVEALHDVAAEMHNKMQMHNKMTNKIWLTKCNKILMNRCSKI